MPSSDKRAIGAPTVPAEFDDLVLWAAWLYYEEQLNQSEIAATLGTSRASIVNYLREARERGAVRITMNPQIMARSSLSRALTDRFGLQQVLVIPQAPGADAAQRLNALGAAGARQLERMIAPDELLCVSWGRTVLAVADNAASIRPVEGITVVQVTGQAMGKRAFSAELCAAIMARNLDAVSMNMLAPAVLSHAGLCQALRREPVMERQFDLIRQARTIVFGVGGLGADSTMRMADIATSAEIDAYAGAGAEAVLICRFIDREGRQIRRAFDDRMMGIELDTLRAIPQRLCVAGGREKTAAIRATLAGGYATHLVTDMDAAQALLEP